MKTRYTVHLYDTFSNNIEIQTYRGVIARSGESAVKFGMKLWKSEKGRFNGVAFSATRIQLSKQHISTIENYTYPQNEINFIDTE